MNKFFPIPKDYMGDGVYIKDDGFLVVLTTENGISITNEIAIEPAVWTNIKRYMKRVDDNHESPEIPICICCGEVQIRDDNEVCSECAAEEAERQSDDAKGH